jgi:hypothetical protein
VVVVVCQYAQQVALRLGLGSGSWGVGGCLRGPGKEGGVAFAVGRGEGRCKRTKVAQKL